MAVHFGPFEILSRIGVGGMGEVFRARRSDGELVALKLLRSDHALEPRFRRMFVAEASIGELLDHPNLVRGLAHGRIGPVHYLVQELVEGAPLSRLLSGAPLPLPLASQVTLSVLAGLGYAHALTNRAGKLLHLVHRDVSPSNVLVSVDGTVKLVDFGVAKLKGVSHTRVNEVKGKRAYLAPELLRPGRPPDQRADLFSVGVMLHRMVSGDEPFTEVAEWVRAGAPLRLEGPLAGVLERALAPDPDRRFGRADELAETLRRAVTPPADATALLAERARAARAAERPLDPLEEQILADLADHADFDNVTPPPSDGSGSNPVIPILNDAAMVASTENTLRLPLPGAPPTEPTEPLTLPSVPLPVRRSSRNRAAIALAVAAAISITLIVVIARSPTTRRPEIAAPLATRVPAPPPAPAAPPTVVVQPITTPPSPRAPPRPASRPRPPAARPPGYLTLMTDPWAVAYHAGQRIGVTPFVRVKLPSGRQQLRLDVEESGRSRPLTVEIAPGAETRLAVPLR